MFVFVFLFYFIEGKDELLLEDIFLDIFSVRKKG